MDINVPFYQTLLKNPGGREISKNIESWIMEREGSIFCKIKWLFKNLGLMLLHKVEIFQRFLEP